MEVLAWLLFAVFCASFAFSDKGGDNNKKDNDQQDQGGNDDNNDDGFWDTCIILGAMDYGSDGELDGNFSDEF